MKDSSIIKIAGKIISLDKNCAINRLAYEEADGFYNVWEIESGDKEYILKQASKQEKDLYACNKKELSVFPRYYGSAEYYGKDYILIEFVDGKNLMNCSRERLVRVLDAMIALQNAYWESGEQIGQPFEKFATSASARREYLNDEELERAFDASMADYRTTIKTLCHGDLLPFNVILNDERVAFIDWECAGMLPYPSMLARFIAHTSEHGETPFYMAKEDVEFAIQYYYDNLVKSKGIDYKTYKHSVDCCLFFEAIEWVYVYNKYGKKHDAFFDYSFAKAKEMVKAVL